jgi:hypothetical protein
MTEVLVLPLNNKVMANAEGCGAIADESVDE